MSEEEPKLDGEEAEEEVEEIDLDALVDERVKAALDKLKPAGTGEAPTGAGGDGGPDTQGPDGGPSSSGPAPIPGDSGALEDKITKVLDSRERAKTLDERLDRLEHPEPTEKPKRRGLAAILFGGDR